MRTILAGMLVGLSAIAATATAQTSAPPQIVLDAIEKVRKECLPEKFEMLKGFMTQRDINGDKITDYILDYGRAQCGDAGTFYCGTGGCLTQVFASRDYDNSHGLVLDENVRRLRFARVKGRPAMLLDLHGSLCGRAGVEPCASTLFWNGDIFHAAN